MQIIETLLKTIQNCSYDLLPSAKSIENAEIFIMLAYAKNLSPSLAMPSIEGGIGLSYRRNGETNKSFYIEFHNDGGATAAFFSPIIETWTVKNYSQTINKVFGA